MLSVNGQIELRISGLKNGNTLSAKYYFSIYDGPTNALVCNKTLIQMSHIKTLKITTTCFDHQMNIIMELFDPG
jgi:hypothetical protein